MLVMGASTSDTVTLTDPEIECCSSVRAILSVIDTFDDDEPNGNQIVFELEMCAGLVLFANKYEMKSVINSIKATLFDLVTRYPPRGGNHFISAAHLGEWALCGRLIETLNEYGDPHR